MSQKHHVHMQLYMIFGATFFVKSPGCVLPTSFSRRELYESFLIHHLMNRAVNPKIVVNGVNFGLIPKGALSHAQR